MDIDDRHQIKILVIGDDNLPNILEFSISENIACNKIIELDGLNIELVFISTNIDNPDYDESQKNIDYMDAIAVIFFVDQ